VDVKRRLLKRSAVLSILIPGLVGALASVPAIADNVLYDNTVSGTSYETGGIGVVAGFTAITDSFTLPQDSTVTGAMFGLWVGSGYQATSVSWAITADPFAGTTLGSGTSNVLSSVNVPTTAPFATGDGADIDQVFIAIPNLALDAGGTYYLELDGVTSNDPNSIGAYWDESDGPSAAYSDLVPYGSRGIAGPSSASQSFQILGTEEGSTVTPEPSSFLLLGCGLLGLAGLVKRKLGP
jgi:hypothetical protein